MQTQKTITLFATVSNSATSRTSKNGRNYTAFGVSILDNDRTRTFHYNVVAFGKQGHFAKPLQKGTRIKLVVQATVPARQHRQHPASHSNLRAAGSSGRIKGVEDIGRKYGSSLKCRSSMVRDENRACW